MSSSRSALFGSHAKAALATPSSASRLCFWSHICRPGPIRWSRMAGVAFRPSRRRKPSPSMLVPRKQMPRLASLANEGARQCGPKNKCPVMETALKSVQKPHQTPVMEIALKDRKSSVQKLHYYLKFPGEGLSEQKVYLDVGRAANVGPDVRGRGRLCRYGPTASQRLAIARSRRRNGWCEFSARLLRRPPTSCRSAAPTSFIAAA